jgi:hypothetical protein
MIDRDTLRELDKWVRLGEEVAGVEPLRGSCERCRETGILASTDRRLCVRCYLEGAQKSES